MVKTIDVLTHPTPAPIPPSRPEATKIASLPMDAPFTVQGRRKFERRGVRGRMLKKVIQRGRRREKTGGVVSGLR
jgi:hypothetical protein